MKKRSSKLLRYSCAGAFLLAATTYIYGTEIEPRGFHIANTHISSPHLSEDLSGLKVLLLSDLHIGSRFMTLDRLKAIVDDINKTDADLVVMPGDFINAGHEFGTQYNFDINDVAEILSNIKHPKIASLGNHEYLNRKIFSIADFENAFEKYGIPVLNNEARKIETRLGAIWLAGLDDDYKGTPDIMAAFEGIPANTKNILFMSHNPTGFKKLNRPVALAVAGDTHCGQINIAGFQPAKYKPHHIKTFDQWTCGAYTDLPEGSLGFVSHGVGTSTFPIRIGVEPQAELLTLTPVKP